MAPHIRLRCERCGSSRSLNIGEGVEPGDHQAYGASLGRLMSWIEEHTGCDCSDDPDPDPVPAPFLGAFDGDQQQ